MVISIGFSWCLVALTADRFGVVFMDLPSQRLGMQMGGLTCCDLGRAPWRRTTATSGWAGCAAMQQSRAVALQALTPTHIYSHTHT